MKQERHMTKQKIKQVKNVGKNWGYHKEINHLLTYRLCMYLLCTQENIHTIYKELKIIKKKTNKRKVDKGYKHR